MLHFGAGSLHSPWVLCTLFAWRQTAEEQPALASLTSELADSASFGYLRLRRSSPNPTPPKGKKQSPKWVTANISDSTPLRCKSKMPLVLRTTHGYTVPPREQPALASLTSELADSASFGYLRLRRSSPHPPPPKKENTVRPNGHTVFLAEKERFGLSRRKNPTYTLSRGASSTS